MVQFLSVSTAFQFTCLSVPLFLLVCCADGLLSGVARTTVTMLLRGLAGIFVFLSSFSLSLPFALNTCSLFSGRVCCLGEELVLCRKCARYEFSEYGVEWAAGED